MNAPRTGADFLTRMSERALGRAPVIDPLVRSRYEPASDLVVEETATEVVTPSAPAARAVPAASPRPLAAPQPAPAIDRPARPRTARAAQVGAEETRVVGESPVEPTTARVLRERGPDAQDRPASQDHFDLRPTASRTDEATPAAPRESVAPAVGAEPEPLDDAESLTPLVPPTRRRRRAGAEIPDAPLAVDTLRTVEADDAPARVEPVAAVAVAAGRRGRERAPDPDERADVTPRSGRTVHARGALRAGPPAPGPVRVTIGRVEVVAPTPAPAPPAPATAPRLSLDEYLRTRGGPGR